MTMTETLPPGPKVSDDEQRRRFNRSPFGYLEELAGELGTIFTVQLGALGNEGLVDVENNGSWVFLSRPHQLKIMYGAGDDTTSGALANRVFFGTDEESVGYIDGTAHRRRRAQLHPAFSGGRDYVAIVSEVVDRCVARWPRDETFALFPELQRLTAEIIVEIVCGNWDKADRDLVSSLLPKTENARYTQEEAFEADAAIRALTERRLDDHLARSDALGRDDVLASLLRHAADGDEALTREVIRDEVFSLLYTGFGTTANTLSWAFVSILSNEDAYQNLMAELNDDFSERPLKRESFVGLKYLEATIMETLRLHPVSAINGVRMLIAPLRIDDYLIPAGTILVHCAHLLQRSEEIYRDPLAFEPGRFVDNAVDPYVFGAFGGSHRTCVGRGYAKEEMKMVLPIVLTALRLELVGDFPGAQRQGFFMAPDNGALCVARSR